ncbi:MAG: hypothetical protein WC558_00850 [Patulibacter sp.]
MPEPRPTIEIVLGDYVLRLDDTIVETLHRAAAGERFHVSHVAVEAKEKRGMLHVRIGFDVSGTIVGGTRIAVPPERQDEVLALFAEARRRRDEIAAGG